MANPVTATWRQLSRYTSANWPYFWRTRFELPLFLFLAGAAAAALVHVFVPDLATVKQIQGFTILGMIALACWWLYSVSHAFPIRSIPAVMNSPRYYLLVAGVSLILVGFLLAEGFLNGFDILNDFFSTVPANRDWGVAYTIGITTVVVLIFFKTAQLYTLRMAFFGVLYSLAGFVVFFIAVVAIETIAGTVRATPYIWLVLFLVFAVSVVPVVRSLASRYRVAYARPALISSFWYAGLACLMLLTFLAQVQAAFALDADTAQVWLVAVVVSLLILGMEILSWVSLKLESFPEV